MKVETATEKRPTTATLLGVVPPANDQPVRIGYHGETGVLPFPLRSGHFHPGSRPDDDDIVFGLWPGHTTSVFQIEPLTSAGPDVPGHTQ